MINFIKRTTVDASNFILKPSMVIREKEGGGNVVLDADLVSERYLIDAIENAYPGHLILSEETRDQLQSPQEVEHLWIVDPLDGSTNKNHDIPLYSVSVAYVERGEVIAAAIYDPNRQELFSAEKGKGALLNGKTIRVSEKGDLKGLIVNIGSPYASSDFDLTYLLGKVFHNSGARIVNFGSAVLECAWVASGRLGAYLEAGLKPWDIAGAQLILSEAGGEMIDPYQIQRPFSIFDQKAILVGNPRVVEALKNLMENS